MNEIPPRQNLSQNLYRDRSPPVRRVLRALGEVGATMKFFAGVEEDLERNPGDPTIAEENGGDTIVVRVGSPRPNYEEIRGAGRAIKSLRKRS